MNGLFISFEGTEGSGKTTQIELLASRIQAMGRVVRVIREPGGTPIGEEIRHTLKHSPSNHAMTPEAELLLLCASRAQLVREIVRPALASGQIILSDRFYDSTMAYQGYGRGLDLQQIATMTDFAVGPTRPNLTLLLFVPLEVSESRRSSRQAGKESVRDRIEEAGRQFFQRVEMGYKEIAAREPGRIQWIDATRDVGQIQADVWAACGRLLG
jgi:dTMP kinase